MRLLLWFALVSALAVEGATILPLLAGLVLVGCADVRFGRGAYAPDVHDLFVG
ncbi:hypothetical protein [Saccharothrix syringae]|uniref:hypothetical protein n=1 Tax=Saccharothrix syringae TaxID=103733 RepID=UPI000AA2B659|nr:hypothetical protein [Saccharothrix syringae]